MIFTRNKNIIVEQKTDIEMESIAVFSDEHHYFILSMSVNIPTLEILDVQLEAKRVPFPACLKAEKKIKDLIGKRIGKGFTQVAKDTLGGGAGCAHLVDIAMDAARGAVQGKLKITHDAEEEFSYYYMPESLRGTCVGFSKDSDAENDCT